MRLTYLATIKTQFLLFLLVILFGTASCQENLFVMNKDQFANDYREFIEDLAIKSKNLEEADWSSYDEKLKEFSQEWYPKFSNELSLREKMEIAKYPLMYELYKYRSLIADAVDKTYRADAQALTNHLTEILDSTADIYYTGFEKETLDVLKEFKMKSTISTKDRSILEDLTPQGEQPVERGSFTLPDNGSGK